MRASQPRFRCFRSLPYRGCLPLIMVALTCVLATVEVRGQIPATKPPLAEEKNRTSRSRPPIDRLQIQGLQIQEPHVQRSRISRPATDSHAPYRRYRPRVRRDVHSRRAPEFYSPLPMVGYGPQWGMPWFPGWNSFPPVRGSWYERPYPYHFDLYRRPTQTRRNPSYLTEEYLLGQPLPGEVFSEDDTITQEAIP